MKERTARKIMKNVRLYQGMIWVYGSDRVDKANDVCLRRLSRTNEGVKKWRAITAENPLLGLKILNNAKK